MHELIEILRTSLPPSSASSNVGSTALPHELTEHISCTENMINGYEAKLKWKHKEKHSIDAGDNISE